MSVNPYYIYTPCTRPADGYGGMSYAFFEGEYIQFYELGGSTSGVRTYTQSSSNYEYIDIWGTLSLGSMFNGRPRMHMDEWWGTYDEIVGRHRKVYCDINTSINYRESILIPFSINGNAMEIGTEEYGEALADKRFLTGSTTYSGVPVVCPCVGVTNNCETVVTVKDEVGNYTVTKNTTSYAIPRKYYSNENKCNNSIRVYNNGTADRLVTVTRNGTVAETITVATGSVGYIVLSNYNVGDRLVLTSEEAKANFKIKTDATTFSDAKKVYVKTADAAFTEAKAVYLKTDSGWQKVM